MAFLRSLKQPVGLALRVGAWPAAQSDKAAPWLADLADSLLDKARTNGLEVSELQIDFDCAESKLDNYRLWLNAIRTRIKPTPLVFTALPSWLKRDAFTPLAKAADGFVLQVHSLERPKSPDAPFQLCDPVAALRAVQKADQVGVPFRVALPTYGYSLAFDTNQHFIGLSAEGPKGEWPETARTVEVRADPAAMAGLVRAWTTNRPAHLQGILWYRLPVSGDRFNWAWPTLASVMTGANPVAKLAASAKATQPGLIDVFIVNTGSNEPTSPVQVTVRWRHGENPVAYDVQNDFSLNQVNSTTLVFSSKRPAPGPGERMKVGWLRFDHSTEVQLEITQ